MSEPRDQFANTCSCGSKSLGPKGVRGAPKNAVWYVNCLECGEEGKRRASIVEAQEAWNKAHPET